MGTKIPFQEALMAMIAMLTVLAFVLIIYCFVPCYRAFQNRRKREEEWWENDPRWNNDRFEFSPNFPEDYMNDKKYSRMACNSRSSSVRSASTYKTDMSLSDDSSFRLVIENEVDGSDSEEITTETTRQSKVNLIKNPMTTPQHRPSVRSTAPNKNGSQARPAKTCDIKKKELQVNHFSANCALLSQKSIIKTEICDKDEPQSQPVLPKRQKKVPQNGDTLNTKGVQAIANGTGAKKPAGSIPSKSSFDVLVAETKREKKRKSNKKMSSQNVKKK